MLRSFDRGPASVLPPPPPPLSDSDCCARLGNDDDRSDDSALLLSQYSTFDGRRAWWTMMHAEPTVRPIVAGEARNFKGDEKEKIRDAIFFWVFFVCIVFVKEVVK
jgi:hypothetical protein